MITKLNVKRINKGLISILDQGLFSGANFVLFILLGRWLLPSDYGAYSVAMSFFLLASGIYSSMVLEPMSVFNPKTKDGEIKPYNGSILVFHLLITVFLSLVLYVGAHIFSSESISAIRIMAITIPFVLAFWLIRWGYYSRSQPGKALLVTILYSIGTIACIFLLKYLKLISSQTTFITTGFVCLLISVFVLASSFKHINLKSVFLHGKMHWGYGKWMVLASILSWISTQFYLVFVASHLSLIDGAGFRAIQNFAQPLELVSTAIGLLLIPWFSMKYAKDSISSLKHIHWINWILGLFGLFYLGIVWLGKDYLIKILYQGKYTSYVWMVPFMVAVPLIMSLSKDAQIGVRVLEKPSIILIAYAFSGIVTLLIGPVLIIYLGLRGAVFGRILSVLVFSVVVYLLYLREKKSKKYETLLNTL